MLNITKGFESLQINVTFSSYMDALLSVQSGGQDDFDVNLNSAQMIYFQTEMNKSHVQI